MKFDLRPELLLPDTSPTGTDELKEPLYPADRLGNEV